MTRHSNARTGLYLLVAFLALLAALLSVGLHVNNSEVVTDQPAEVLPVRNGQPVVAVLRESGGLSLFGIRINRGAQHVEVRLLAPRGCSGRLRTGDPWPSPIAQCSTAATIAGTVRGFGTTPSGDSLIGVEFEVSRTCFEHLRRGMTWPPTDPECAAHTSTTPMMQHVEHRRTVGTAGQTGLVLTGFEHRMVTMPSPQLPLRVLERDHLVCNRSRPRRTDIA